MLEGKVAVVTGSAKRTGSAIALALAEKGADVVVHYNKSRKDAGGVVREIRKLGRNSIAIRADLTDNAEVQLLFRKVIAKYKRIDILVNNVGNFLFKDISRVSPEEWDFLVDTTLNTTFRCCHSVLPYMRKQKYGRIINLADSLAD